MKKNRIIALGVAMAAVMSSMAFAAEKPTVTDISSSRVQVQSVLKAKTISSDALNVAEEMAKNRKKGELLPFKPISFAKEKTKKDDGFEHVKRTEKTASRTTHSFGGSSYDEMSGWAARMDENGRLISVSSVVDGKMTTVTLPETANIIVDVSRTEASFDKRK